MKRNLCLLGALTPGGCVARNLVPASVDGLKAHRGQDLTIVTYDQPDFIAASQSVTVSTGIFGVAGTIARLAIQKKIGNEIVRQNGIPDPALDISTQLSPILQDVLKPSGTKRLANVSANATDEGTISRLAGNNGIVLDVQTVSWEMVFFLFSIHYRVVVAIHARLIDANTGTIVAQAPCTYRSSEENAPTYDQMLADHAARLKTMLVSAANSCAATMQKEFFGKEDTG
jgi:hypothetical protein